MLPVVLVLLLAAPGPAPRGDELVGALGVHLVAPGESLIEIARLYDVGFNEIAATNPHLDPYVPTVGAVVLVPTAWILPSAAVPGTIVVNLSEMRLYYIPGAGRPPITFPIGVAVDPHATPLGVMSIVEKSVAPAWHPTLALLREDPTLPAMVPPGPDNPLGSHALRLSRRTILIHGTNRPFGVGRKVSHGCIRLYPEDIPRLFRLVEIGTPVAIVREPVKVAVREGRIWVEIHDDASVAEAAVDAASRLLAERGVFRDVDARKLARAAQAKRGIPVLVTAAPRCRGRARGPAVPRPDRDRLRLSPRRLHLVQLERLRGLLRGQLGPLRRRHRLPRGRLRLRGGRRGSIAHLLAERLQLRGLRVELRIGGRLLVLESRDPLGERRDLLLHGRVRRAARDEQPEHHDCCKPSHRISSRLRFPRGSVRSWGATASGRMGNSLLDAAVRVRRAGARRPAAAPLPTPDRRTPPLPLAAMSGPPCQRREWERAADAPGSALRVRIRVL